MPVLMKHTFYLRQSLFVFLFFMLATVVNAQKKHFIYIQAEGKQPFYVMLNNKNYSSSLSGYLVIPKLKNGRYFFTAGFPKDLYPEQKFSCVVDDKDLGYSLKRFGDKGWGLFDYVSFNTIMANPTDWEKDKAVYDTVKLNTDEAFVPDVVKPVAKPVVSDVPSKKIVDTTPQTDKQQATAKSSMDNPVATKPIDAGLNQSVNLLVTSVPPSSSQSRLHIAKTYDKSNGQGIDQVYVDYMPNRNDTIAIFIPYASQEAQNEQKKEVGFDTTKHNVVGNSNQYNRSCVHLATDEDYARIRRQMSYETTDDKMIASARRSFKNKCVTTDQIRNLGLLFLSEQNRYKFFASAKPFIYDVFNYPSLEIEFKVGNMIEQFRKSAN
jgi:hypothetical protein